METLGCERGRVVFVRRWNAAVGCDAVFHLGEATAYMALPPPTGCWQRTLDSSDERWRAPRNLVPSSLTSEGEVSVDLPLQGFLLLLRGEQS